MLKLIVVAFVFNIVWNPNVASVYGNKSKDTRG